MEELNEEEEENIEESGEAEEVEDRNSGNELCLTGVTVC